MMTFSPFLLGPVSHASDWHPQQQRCRERIYTAESGSVHARQTGRLGLVVT